MEGIIRKLNFKDINFIPACAIYNLDLVYKFLWSEARKYYILASLSVLSFYHAINAFFDTHVYYLRTSELVDISQVHFTIAVQDTGVNSYSFISKPVSSYQYYFSFCHDFKK